MTDRVSSIASGVVFAVVCRLRSAFGTYVPFWTTYKPPFQFTGTIEKVVIDLKAIEAAAK